ncbi:UMP kinase [Candidatus Woesearchaeota archaeon]|nr:UMP kinase [Candidatus Woesearchaeota archaeon]
MQNKFVISLGGSLIFPDDLDKIFLMKFRKIIQKHAKKGRKFIIICGGGKLARSFQQAASKKRKLSNEELDWLGIHATKINAHLLKSIFGNNAEDFIVGNPNAKINFKKSILVAAGWLPGWSTDYDAVMLAKNIGIREVINMSNVDYVYDKDPRKNRDAKKIEKISWNGYNKLISKKWKAGMNVPFDPVAAKEAQKSKMKVNIIGSDLKNFENLLNGKKFRGTVIK